MEHKLYDAKGLNCPLPVMQAKKDLKVMDSGSTLEVLCTDPCSVKNFDTFCRSSNYNLLESTEDGGIFRFVIRK
ncbi:MAG: sulfurtransferase TusA family protein [Alphaproteobacteria bacterium]|jgi:tRNA 2-thiouridine synthesizing protein A|nr:sulfurtransferase TusA family protein [Alphaproteobacteria bacterium]